ncbi:hypothetical protein AGMMS50239_18680 [Bacteroidia bacterium]|nr:hypothetical protein AGMMS50239_18680 [Bacteroidia bacterium]
MRKIINNMQGIFIRSYYSSLNDILSDIYGLEYIGAKNDKKNISNDVSNLFLDLNFSIKEAKAKLNN